MAIYYPSDLQLSGKRPASPGARRITRNNAMKLRLNVIVAGALPSIVCHVLVYGLFTLIMVGLQRYGSQSLHPALDYGLIFGTVFGAVYGLKTIRWYQGAILEVIACVCVAVGGVGTHSRDMLSVLGLFALTGALSVLVVNAAKAQLRAQIYPYL